MLARRLALLIAVRRRRAAKPPSMAAMAPAAGSPLPIQADHHGNEEEAGNELGLRDDDRLDVIESLQCEIGGNQAENEDP